MVTFTLFIATHPFTCVAEWAALGSRTIQKVHPFIEPPSVTGAFWVRIPIELMCVCSIVSALHCIAAYVASSAACYTICVSYGNGISCGFRESV